MIVVPPPLHIDEHFAPTADGWRLHLKRTVAPERLVAGRRPLVIIPGYGMNAFIFGFHPRGTSMERCLAEAGFEVWSANLRGQGASRADNGAPQPSLRAYAEHDMAAVLAAVLAHTETGAGRVDVIGASLGGSVLYAYLALTPEPPIGSAVCVGAPLRWLDVNLAVRFAFGSPRVASMLRLRGTRDFARRMLPLAARIPGVLNLYMNTSHVDMSQAAELTRTVEDPVPRVNSDIAKWIRQGDMVLRGVNVTQALRRAKSPLLLVLANRDGIVPAASALAAADAWGDKRTVETLRIGDDQRWFAHADLFVGDPAPQMVFDPIARWLQAKNTPVT